MRMPITTISKDASVVTFINVFTVEPVNQQRLVDCIRNAGDASAIPGLLSMHLLCSTDGTRVTTTCTGPARMPSTGPPPAIR